MTISKALVVDDSKVVRVMFKRMLEARGLGVETANPRPGRIRSVPSSPAPRALRGGCGESSSAGPRGVMS